MAEAKSGRLRGTTPVDTSSMEAMFKSVGLLTQFSCLMGRN